MDSKKPVSEYEEDIQVFNNQFGYLRSSVEILSNSDDSDDETKNLTDADEEGITIRSHMRMMRRFCRICGRWVYHDARNCPFKK
ncbi:hypothetical protein Hanom_Chr03g00236721 [Helianthus anomalus]